jgi:hypothetical protein
MKETYSATVAEAHAALSTPDSIIRSRRSASSIRRVETSKRMLEQNCWIPSGSADRVPLNHAVHAQTLAPSSPGIRPHV